ncbi:MAG: hypothetical protein L0332_15390 [Chloroflexi bacterium]|nr:hypothetical protein [Chloroflexota bacterium]MCI0580662.1 hypothetical protein [Chloroflexota bacterium]MCI0648678.1 hypothetical protein [Chloroflexota bacterium]MCI0728086.1 hypothetical protein [Chloroflexota bacterium]
MEGLSEFVPIIIIAVVLAIGWVLLRVAFKLTATLFRVGCFIILLIVAAGVALTFLG